MSAIKLLEEARKIIGQYYFGGNPHSDLLARIDALLKTGGWEPMVSAPLDGTEINLLIRHPEYWTVLKVNGKEVADREYQGMCRGKWIDHNGGGWCWHGIAGTQVGWKPLPDEKD